MLVLLFIKEVSSSPSFSMPKKRISKLYSKPQSTVHPSLNSGAATISSSSSQSNAQSTSVNELIQALRQTQVTPSNYNNLPPTFTTQTLPPQTRALLSQPETPAPRPRYRSHGIVIQGVPYRNARVAGPAPPRSWLDGSRHAPAEMKKSQPERLYPASIYHLPGLADEYVQESKSRTLQGTCLRAMARNWTFIGQYEANYLADLPLSHKIKLLSNIAVHGPEEGIGRDALNNLILGPGPDVDSTELPDLQPSERNEELFRLDLSGSFGRSISSKQIIELLTKPAKPAEDSGDLLTWEETIARPLAAPIPYLTHLSLSHPPPTVSWPKLLALANHLPTVTHLSLAYWPVPCLLPNARATVMTSKHSKDVQYGNTGFYSHSLDDDYHEAVAVLHRLGRRVYGLEFLDLSGCNWLRALSWDGGEEKGPGLDWSSVWVKMKTLRVHSGRYINEDSTFEEVFSFARDYEIVQRIEETLGWWLHKDAIKRRREWIHVEKDSHHIRFCGSYDISPDKEKQRKQRVMDELEVRRQTDPPANIIRDPLAAEHSPSVDVPWGDDSSS
ncbi:hypothetical protein BJ875DRAFT_476358 [Amylocarpus encephaloides]|uniref:Tafazzin n=1 Tax=Amylocarpus encephaloides TaxID=45428 RepID=A0A9P8BZX4_9HELO|nr:hypothetical protein BJ875DRAFT_476358 [Amylocarpus encephaloides]